MNLFQIDSQINAILENGYYLDKDTGEVKIEDDLDQLAMERNEKIENIAMYVKNLEALTKAIKEEESALKERRSSLEAKTERLQNYLSSICEGRPFTTSKCAISFRASTVCEITDESIIPQEYIKVKESYSIDKAAIKNALKDGAVIDGAKLTTKSNITIK